MRASRVCVLALLGAFGSASSAIGAPVEKAPAAAPEASRVKPAAERSVELVKRGDVAPKKATSNAPTGIRPDKKGPRLPEELRAKLKPKLDARIERDVQEMRGLRKEAIRLLTTFLKETPREEREVPEALMRLGELRWEDEREAFTERFKAWELQPIDRRGPAPDPNFAPARELFARVLRDYKWFAEYDLALYVDGFLATEQGKQDEAIERFTRILKEFPSSRFVPDAHMARAEVFFGSKYDYASALSEYEEVLKFKKSDLYGLALFKSAWCLWRLGRSEEAARRFVGVFEVADKKTADGAEKKQLDELQSEALKYLVEVFTEDEKNTAGDVYGFLTKIGGERFSGKVVKALAETFYDQAHYERGIQAYELLLKLEPTNRDAGMWVLEIANGYALIEDYPRLKTTYDRATTDYMAGGKWTKTQTDPAATESTAKAIDKQLLAHSTELHGRAQKDKTSRAEYEGAAALYEIYAAKFDSEPKAYLVHFYLGEIYFYHLARNTDAATHYMSAARKVDDASAQKEPDRSLRHDALYNAIAALERVRFAELEARKKTPGAPAQETESDKKFAEALDLYVQLYPTDPALPELLFRQGRLYYDYGVYDPAVKIWGGLLEKFPRSPYAGTAGELILDSFNRAKNYENIETWARRLKSAPAFQSADQQKKLDTLIVQSVFKQGEQKLAAGDAEGAAVAYLRAAKEFPRDQRAAQACVNAELAAKKSGNVAVLKEAAQLVTSKEFKGQAESPQGAWIAATSLQSMGLLADAATFHEAILTSADKDHPNYQKFEHAKDAGFNSVLLYASVGENDRAVAAGGRFLAAYGNSAEADEVVFQMGKAHQNAGRNKEAVELYRRYLSRTKNIDHKAQGYVRLAEAQIKTKDDRGADESLKSAVLIGKRQKAQLGPDGKFAVAHARYMEGERILQKFEQIQIQGDVKQLSLRLKQKAELLKQASTVFLDTVSLGVAEWSTAALFQIGHTYEAFAKSLRDAPPPSGLSDADKELYQQQIDEFVVPIEERSLDAYENGWKKAIDLGIYNQWTAKMRDALGRLNGELYPPFREVGFEIRSQSPSPLPDLIDAPRRAVAPKSKGAK